MKSCALQSWAYDRRQKLPPTTKNLYDESHVLGLAAMPKREAELMRLRLARWTTGFAFCEA